jgi:hypothetical protein
MNDEARLAGALWVVASASAYRKGRAAFLAVAHRILLGREDKAPGGKAHAPLAVASESVLWFMSSSCLPFICTRCR